MIVPSGEPHVQRFSRRFAQALVLAVGLITIPLAGCSKPKETGAVDTGPKVIPITVKPMERKAIERKIDVVGSLKGWEEFYIGAKKGGRVLKIYHDIGDRVKPGEVIAELDPVDARLAVVQAERNLLAELAQLGLNQLPSMPNSFDVNTVPLVVKAKVDQDRAMQNLTRERAISQRGASSTQDLQNAENDFRAAEAGLAAARVQASAILAGAQVAAASLDVAKQTLSDLNIVAPTPKSLPPNGQVVQYAIAKRMVAEGQYLRDGESLAELVIEDPLKYLAKVPERYSSQIKLGQDVGLKVAAFEGRTFSGRITRINPSVDPISRTFQVEANIPNPKNELRPGGFAKADVLIDRKGSGVIVPIEALVRTVGVTKIFMVVDDLKSPTKLVAREIQVTTDTEGAGWIEIIGNLPQSGNVVTSGQSQLADGTPVRIKTADDQEKTEAKKAEAKPETTAPAKPETKPAAGAAAAK